MKKYNIAIVGATGTVGQELLQILAERDFPVGELKLLASSRSAGTKITFKEKVYEVAEAGSDSFAGIDIALFAGGSISKTLAPEAVKAGAVVIDNSSTFRMSAGVPLVVPEVNAEELKHHQGIIANPNCSTIIMVMALQPLLQLAAIKRVVVSTYQAVSGAGKEAMAELQSQCEAIMQGEEPEAKVLPVAKLDKHYQIAFNLIPQIDVFCPDDYTKEEHKMIDETRKILALDDLKITATTVRVPVWRSHAESLNVEFETEVTAQEAKEALEKFPGVTLLDNPGEMLYPMPLDTAGKDDVYVGRVRCDDSVEHGLNLWLSGDQIRKGAALNAIQIAEKLIDMNLIS